MNRIYLVTFLSLYALNSSASNNAILPVCERTAQIHDFVVAQLGKPCEEIGSQDLAQLKVLRVPKSGITTLKAGDFSGMTQLDVLNLKRNDITALPRGIFAG